MINPNITPASNAQVKDTGAIIVTYFPVVENLRRLIQTVSTSCFYCVIVDNTPVVNAAMQQLEKEFSNLTILFHEDNLGIAKAQNIGVDYLFDKCNFFIFFDQDSQPGSSMIEHLYRGFLYLLKTSYKTGAVGPSIINKATGKPYVARVQKGRRLPEAKNIKEVPQLISSGTFFSKDSWLATGKMNEQLFIDGVDLEWCWRGKHKSLLHYFIIDDAVLHHSVGEDKKLFGIRIKAPAPIRCYYLYRNYFYLVKLSYVPLYWKFSSGIKYVIKLFVFPLFLNPQKQYLKNILRGIRDGVKFLYS